MMKPSWGCSWRTPCSREDSLRSPVHSSQAALDRMNREFFDIIVTELWAPAVDGLRILRRSRQLNAERSVILMTGHGGISALLEEAGRGVYHSLLKPFSPLQLLGLLDRSLVRESS
jgi:DNA-binding NtrC family response regulator